MPADDAAWLAQALVETELWGVATHGLALLPAYLAAMAAGEINPRPTVRVLSRMTAVEARDGDGGSGLVLARAAMTRAVELAANHGIGMVTTRNSTHFGAAGLYSALAARAGMVGLALTSAVPTMAAPGGVGTLVGNNPLSVSAPRGEHFPFLIDMALSVAAFNRVKQAAADGLPVPPEWGIDIDGEPTTDPARVQALLAAGGHKGVGLALASEVLTSIVGGGATLSDISASGTAGRGPTHTMIAISTALVDGESAFADRLGNLAEHVGRARVLGDEPSRLPGERRAATRARRLAEGVPLPDAVVEALHSWGKTLDVRLGLTPLG